MNHGGKRTGSGRKPIQYSTEFRGRIWKALEKEARKQGKSIYEIFATNIMKADTEPRIFSRLWKILAEIMASKESHQTIETRTIGPTIGLPPIKYPDPTDNTFPIINLSSKKDGYKH